MKASPLSILETVVRAIAPLVVLVGAAGCALYFPNPFADSGGYICVGFGCSSESRPNRLNMSFEDWTKFESSVKPSVDNFLRRYRSSPDNPELNRRIDDFFMPARRLLGKEFEFDPAVVVEVKPMWSSIYASVKQKDWREVTESNPSFKRFMPLAQGSIVHVGRNGAPLRLSSEIVDSIRWRIEAKTKITAVSSNTIRYRTDIDVFMEARLGLNYYHVTEENEAFRILAERLHQALLDDYISLFEREYGLKIKRER